MAWYSIARLRALLSKNEVRTMLTVAEIAEEFGVSRTAVYNWLGDGLPYKTERVVGVKRRIIIDPQDVITHLNLSRRRG